MTNQLKQIKIKWLNEVKQSNPLDVPITCSASSILNILQVFKESV